MVSDEAVKKATGKNWKEWVAVIDRAGGGKMTHKEIARMLDDKGYVKSGWWCQMVTVGYEYAKKRRVTGETAEAGWEMGATKTIPVDPKKAWQWLTSPEGVKVWLGGERIRLTYRPRGWKQASTLQLTVTPRQSMRGTCIGFHQEKILTKSKREKMYKFWHKVLDEIARRW